HGKRLGQSAPPLNLAAEIKRSQRAANVLSQGPAGHRLLSFETRVVGAALEDGVANLLFAYTPVDDQGRSSTEPEETVLDVFAIERDRLTLINDCDDVSTELPVGRDTARRADVIDFEG